MSDVLSVTIVCFSPICFSYSGIGAGVIGDQTTDEIINEVDWDNMVDSEEEINLAEDEDGGEPGEEPGEGEEAVKEGD